MTAQVMFQADGRIPPVRGLCGHTSSLLLITWFLVPSTIVTAAWVEEPQLAGLVNKQAEAPRMFAYDGVCASDIVGICHRHMESHVSSIRLSVKGTFMTRKYFLGIVIVLLVWLVCGAGLTSCDASGKGKNMGGKPLEYDKPAAEELKKKLTPEQYFVTQEAGTEAPFKNQYWNNHEPGIYVDVTTGEPLFSSLHKFDSGTGWPSFFQPLEKGHIVSHEDTSYGMVRTEVRSRDGKAHLGHLFNDGPAPTGQRYCINSASLRFVPATRIWHEGYGRFVPDFEVKGIRTDAPERETAVLAGGCFWGMQDILRAVPGVVSTRVGYTGGHLKNPRYEDTHDSKSGHAESVEVIFDPRKLSYEELLRNWFFRMHDPTTKDRQGNDRGSQYRSAIFYQSEIQRSIAQRVKRAVDVSGKWKAPVVTEIAPAATFYPAEDYHQDYLVKHPGGYTCHFLRD